MVDPTCKLCQVAPETHQHFVGECAFFEDERRVYIEKLSTILILSRLILKLRIPDFLAQLTGCDQDFQLQALLWWPKWPP